MIALLRKDWRLYRSPIVGGMIIMLIPYLIGALAAFLDWQQSRQSIGMAWNQADVVEIFAHASVISLCLIGLLAAIFGGVSFAQERRERWAEFLSTLPVRKSQVILSKLVLCLLVLGPIWIVNIYLVIRLSGATVGRTFDISRMADRDLLFMDLSLSAAFMAFSVAWLASARLTSPSIAVAIAIAATVASLIWPKKMFPEPIVNFTDDQFARLLIGTTLCIGTVCFIAGTSYYLRRVEP
jgi:ABC-type transport system involved in multi-copper enzyme maturation permease subunit